MAGHAEMLGRSVAQLEFEALPPDVIESTKCQLLDALLTVAASRGAAGGDLPVQATLSARSAEGSVVLFSARRAPATETAFVNAQRSVAMDFGSNLFFSQGLPGVTIFPALAVGEALHSSGKELLTAVAAGFETAARVALSLPPPYSEGEGGEILSRGMPLTRWIGFGGAAAVAKILKLSDAQTAHALSLAGASVPIPPGLGLFRGETEAMAKYGLAGVLASTSVWSGLLARQGFTGDTAILDATGAFHPGLGVALFDESPFHRPFGDPWYITESNFKRYPSGTFNQQALHALSALVAAHKVAADDVDEIVVDRALGTDKLFAAAGPGSYVGAQFSMPYAAAMVYLGVPLPEWGSRVADSDVNLLASRIRLVRSDRSVSEFLDTNRLAPVRSAWTLESEVTVRASGAEVTMRSDYGQVTRDEIIWKWRSWDPPRNLDEILDAVDRFEELSDVGEFAALLLEVDATVS